MQVSFVVLHERHLYSTYKTSLFRFIGKNSFQSEIQVCIDIAVNGTVRSFLPGNNMTWYIYT